MPKSGIQNALNSVRSQATIQYQEGVPMVTANSLISDIANPILNYQAFANEFISGLVNRIALTKISNMVYNNPLAIFKKGSVPLGTDIQDVYTNPVKSEEFGDDEVEMVKLLSRDDPDTKVAYYRINRKDRFPVSVNRDQLEGAFVSWEALEELISSITNALYSGNYIKEFALTKALVSGAVKNHKVIMEKVDAVTNESSAKSFVKKCRNLYAKFKFPSTNYNAYSKMKANSEDTDVVTWTNDDRIVLLVSADVMTEVDVEVLASAFNIESSKLMGRIVMVDRFDDPNIQAVICDEAFFQIYDNKLKFTEFYNARTMVTNFYLHAWGTFSISPFANAVALVTEIPEEPEETEEP